MAGGGCRNCKGIKRDDNTGYLNASYIEVYKGLDRKKNTRSITSNALVLYLKADKD